MSEKAPGSVGDLLEFRLLDCSPGTGMYTLSCRTQLWMRNFAGTLHGGMGAAILDQAMGYIAYCLKPGEGSAPAVQLSVDFHRPMTPGEDVLIKVCLISATRSLIKLSAQIMRPEAPDKPCFSGSGLYFFKPES